MKRAVRAKYVKNRLVNVNWLTARALLQLINEFLPNLFRFRNKRLNSAGVKTRADSSSVVNGARRSLMNYGDSRRGYGKGGYLTGAWRAAPSDDPRLQRNHTLRQPFRYRFTSSTISKTRLGNFRLSEPYFPRCFRFVALLPLRCSRHSPRIFRLPIAARNASIHNSQRYPPPLGSAKA
jgi:hypothetical protein